MDILFDNFTSNNAPAVLAARNELINKIQNEPMFIQEIFHFLEYKLKSDSNPNIIKAICLVISEMIERKQTDYFSDPNLKEFLFTHLLADVFLLPFEDRSLLSCFLFYFFHHDKISQTIFHQCTNQIGSNSMTNISTSLYILSNLIGTCINENRNVEIQAYYSTIINFLVGFVNKSVEYFQSILLDQIDENKKQEISIFAYSISSIVDLYHEIIRKKEMLNIIDPQDNFVVIIMNIISLLQQNSVPTNLKANISAFIKSLITNLFSSIRSNQPDSKIRQIFQNQLLPIIGQSVFACFKTANLDHLVLSYLFDIVCQMVQNAWFLNIIVNPEFILQIIIPSCYIQNDELQLFKDIPIQFLTYCYPIEKLNMNLVRISVFKLLDEIGKLGNDPIAMILSCCQQNPQVQGNNFQNQLNYESRLFVMSSVLKYVSNEPNIFKSLFEIASTCNQPLLVATSIFALQFMRINKEMLNLLSISKIINQEQPISIRLLSVRLFKISFDPYSTIIKSNIESNFQNLLFFLLELSDSSGDEEVIAVIILLFNQYPNLIENYSVGILDKLFYTWNCIIQNSEDKFKVENDSVQYVNIICELLSKIPQNSQLFYVKGNDIYGLFKTAITIFSDSNYLTNYLDLMTIFFDHVDNPNLIPKIYEIVPFLFTYYQNFFYEQEGTITSLIELLVSIVKKPLVFECEFNCLQIIINFVGMIVSKTKKEANSSSAFILLSAIVQVGCGKYNELALQSINYFSQQQIQQDKLYLYVSQLVLLSSALYFDHSFIQNLNNQIINNIIQNIKLLKEAEDNYIRIILIGLSIIASQGIPGIYDYCVPLLNRFFKKNMENAESEYDENQGFGNFVNGINFIEDDTPHYSLPSDNFNFAQSFIGLEQYLPKK